MKTIILSFLLILSISVSYHTDGFSFAKNTHPYSTYSTPIAYCPDSNGVDSDNDDSEDLCDLDDDNDGIPDLIECPDLPINFNGFSGGSHLPGDGDEIQNTYVNGEQLPQPISISAPVSFGGANDFSLSGIGGGAVFRMEDAQQYMANSGFVTTLTTPLPAAFKFSTSTTLSSQINNSVSLEITPINPSSDFLWNIISSNSADINIAPTDILEITGNGNSNFAKFEIEILGVCEGLSIKLTNLTTSAINDPLAVNAAQFMLTTCQDIDFDGVTNKFDLDSDNDGILDVDEAGHGAEDLDHDGRIDGQDYDFDDNGLFDDLETSPESGLLNYNIGDSESTPDGIYDAYEIDADGDTCFDALEENIEDSDNDGIAGTGIPTVDANGLVNSITYANPLISYWRNPMIGPCLLEICNDGIDNDGDSLIDCLDCEDCLDASHCEDQDHDGVNNFCDLDDDNDGILDTSEGNCATSIRLIGWSHNRDDPIGLPKGHYLPNFDDHYVSAANDETNGPGTSIRLIYSNSIIGDVQSTSLADAIANEDYLPYVFSTQPSWTEHIEINSISHYNALELQNQDASYNFSVLYSTDGFTTSNTLIENVHVRPIDIHILDVIKVKPIPFLPATNYEFRVYFYNLKGHFEFGWDDFSLGGCQHIDTDNDGVFDFYDLDSDDDGCVDAIEGTGEINLLNLINDTITGGVSTNGIPTLAGSSGQDIGTSQNELQQSDACDVCNVLYHSNIACDDNDVCTALDTATISLIDGSICIPCNGIPATCTTGPSSVIPCDDGDISTINDQVTVLDCGGTVCIPCAGTPIDCSNGTTTVISCNDNNPCTVNDVESVLDIDGSICVPCAGTLIDCSANNTSTVSCDDGNIYTINDQQTVMDCDGSICIPCAGTPVDCNTGTTSIINCNDNNPCTENDVQTILDSDGSICMPCAGTPMDCSNGATSVVSCDDGNIFTINDIQTILDCDNSICLPCLGTPVDCTNGTTSIVNCNDNNPCTENDVQTILDSDGSTCIPCAGTPMDCATGSTSVVSCDDGNVFTINDIQTILDCDNSICLPCLGTPVDCTNGTTSIVNCNDNNPCTENDQQTILDSDGSICIPCAGTPMDCATGTTSVVSCDDGNIFTINDIQTILNCDNSICLPCLGTPVDCTNGTTSIVNCNDNNPCTENDQQTILDSDGSICIPCAGTPMDCSNGTTSVVSCDDGNVFTINDIQTILDCDNSICLSCLGTPVDCTNGTTSIVNCDDNNPCTENDVQTILDSDGSICIPCAGTPMDCATGSTSVVSCDDGNVFTINDIQTILNCDNSICLPCLGTQVDCTNGTTSIVNCNDNNPCTENDVQTILDSDGSICIPCAGSPMDCATGSTSVVSCDDGNIFTINDIQTILDCDNSICIPCLGTPVDCETGTTTLVSCNDRNPCTINDQQTILDSDSTVCIPCAGIEVDCSTGPSAIVPCDDGDPCTQNDQMTILDCDASVCIPCQGSPIELEDLQVEDITICQHGSIPVVEATGGNNEADFNWYNADPALGEVPIFTGINNSFSPFINTSIPGTYTYWVIQKIEGCESSPVSFNINIDSIPIVDAGAELPFDCESGEVMLSGSVPLDDYEVNWFGPDASMQHDIINPFVMLPGTYIMEILDPVSGCTAVDSVDVLSPIDILANNDYLSYFEGDIYQINVLANDSLSGYEEFTLQTFDLSSGNILINDENIIYYTPEEKGFNRTESFTYEVCAVGCPEVCAQALVTIDVSAKNVYIPNAFSPNADGHNDYFYVSGESSTIKEVRRFEIFNRWGAQIFGAKNIPINQPDLGWNGLFKGEKAGQNVFIYFAEVEFTDGSILIFSGDVSVLY